MIRIRLLLLVMFFSLLSACSDEKRPLTTDENDEVYEEYNPTGEDARELCENVFKCILNEDKDALAEMFSPEIQERSDLHSQIEAAFEFIDGDIVEYVDPDGSIGSGRWRDGKKVKVELDGIIKDVVTETGKTYWITFSSYAIYEDNPNLIGVTSIRITSRDEYVEGVGYPTYCIIGQYVE